MTNLNVDRDIPNLKTTKKKTNITKLVFVGGALVAVTAVAGGGALFMKQLEENKRQEVALREKQQPKEAPPSPKDFDGTKRRIKSEDEAMMPPPASAAPATAAPAASAGAGSTTTANQSNATPIEKKPERSLTGSVLVFGEGTATAGRASGNRDLLGSAPGTPPPNGFDDKLRPSQLIAGQAGQRPDLSFLMRRGTSIPCGQRTRIVTTHPGMVACQVSKNVYSANGDVLLVERGSEVFGEQRAAMMQGQASIEVLWTRIDTPTGVAVDINSLGTDPLGASGIPAYVDNHLGERFGGAVMLSLISDFGQALANKSSESAGQIKLSTTSTAGQDLASQTLKNTINIPPTAYSLQGSAINIFVARDMDFRSVYELARY